MVVIISHKHKFIFIKTEKTAGTSIEVALCKYCGPDDIITPISPEDENKRLELGYRGPQNYYISPGMYSKADYLRAIYNRRLIQFYNHASASFIRKYISNEVWNSYFKFCFERNPWDKAVSWYFWHHKQEPRPTISEFIKSGKANNIKGFELYTINSEIVVDEVFRFEELNKSMEVIGQRIGLPEVPTLPDTKRGYRKDKRSYRDMLSDKDKQKLKKVYAREIAHFGYVW
jgi:hypothetical protein